MVTIETRNRDVVVTNAPRLTPEEDQELIFLLRSMGGFQGTYEDARQRILDMRATPIVPTPGQVRDADRLTAQASAPPQAEEPSERGLIGNFLLGNQERPNTNLGGMLGGATRGLGPYSTGAAIGAGIGSVVPGLGTAAGAGVGVAAVGISNAVISLVNMLAGTDLPTTSESFGQLLNAAGVEQPDTVIEGLIQAGADGVGQAQGLISLAQQLAPVAGQITAANPSTLQRSAAQLAENPTQQLHGAFRAPFGAEGGRATAEAAGAGPTGQTVAATIGGVGADVSASVSPMPGARVVRESAEQMASAGITPQAAREAIRVGDAHGVTVRRSDIFPPDTPMAHAFQGLMDAFGGARLGALQQRGRNRFAREMLEEYGLSPGAVRRMAPELAEEFASTRQTAFNRFSAMKQRALDAVPIDEAVPVENTVSFIDDVIESLERRGNVNADVNTATSPSMTAADAAASNEFQSLITRLRSWRAMFQNKNMSDLEMNRATFGARMIPEGGYSQLGPDERMIIEGVYDSVRQDIGEAVRTHGGQEAYDAWRESNQAMFDMMRDLQQAEIGLMLKNVQGQDNVAIANGNTPLSRLDEATRQTVMQIRQNPEILENVFINGTPSQIQTVMPYMTTEGRRRALSAMLYQDMRASIPDVRNLSGNELSRQLQDSFTRREIVMLPEDREIIEGAGLLLDITRRAEPQSLRKAPNVAAQLPTSPGMAGMALRGAASSTGAFVGTVFGGAAIGRNISYMYESPQIRDLLLDLVEAGAGSPRAETIAGRILQMLTPSPQRAPLIAGAGLRAAGRELSATEQLPSGGPTMVRE